MPLPLTFGKPPVGAKKHLDSIHEGDEDSDSTMSSASPKAKSLDYSTAPKLINIHSFSSQTKDDSARKTEQKNAIIVNNALSVATTSNAIPNDANIIPDLSELTKSIKRIIDAQLHQQILEDRCNAILQHVQSSKEEVAVIHQDIKQILKKNDGKSSQPLDILIASMRELSNELNSSNAEHRESMLNLKMSAENERKALHAQLSNERLISSNMRNELEKQTELQSIEKNKLEIEKEKLARRWKELERSEALFEQRKMAASEVIEDAEKMTSMIRAAELRLSTEMERLIHLSDYVRGKDVKAEEQLERVRELTNNLLEIDVSRDEYFVHAEKNQQAISDSRMILARERVAMLKKRARERERRQGSNTDNW